MKLDEKIENLVTQYNENEEELKKLRDGVTQRESLKMEITGALKALNSIKEEMENDSAPAPKKKAKKATAA